MKLKFLTKEKMKEMSKADMKERVRFLRVEERTLKNYISNHQKVINKILSDMWRLGQAFELDNIHFYLKWLSKEKHVLEDKLSFIKLEKQLLRSHLILHQYEDTADFREIFGIYVECFNEELETYPLDNDTVCQYEFEDEESRLTVTECSIEFDITPMKLKRMDDREMEISGLEMLGNIKDNKIWEKYM
ncbi:hypothetical protein [Paenibacillus odorifer]|uniref:hypothetical protein n=1 Tax=Paenibacillus odorifer TaxID=189426 RepID=UPI0020BE78D3|nr:hypothetical protein [Paenibacillus odorifer]